MQAGVLTGRILGEYRLGQPLGDDGFGPIYEAQHLQLRRSFRVRILSDRFTFASGFEEQFQRVAQVLAVLDHPNLLSLDDYGATDPYAYLVTPFVEGISLEAWLRQRPGPVGPPQVIRLFGQMLAAFHYAHQAGVTHLGLEPRHLVLQPNGHLLVANFGLPYLAEQLWIAWNGSRSFGDPCYLAPEQFPGRTPSGASSDLYTLGLILYRLLTGALPFEGPLQAILTAKLQGPPQLRAKNPALPPSLEEVVSRALMPSPHDRWPDVATFGGAFYLALEQAGQPIPSELLAGMRTQTPSLPGSLAAKLLAGPEPPPPGHTIHPASNTGLTQPTSPPDDAATSAQHGSGAAWHPSAPGNVPETERPPLASGTVPGAAWHPTTSGAPTDIGGQPGTFPTHQSEPAVILPWTSAGKGRLVPPPPPPGWQMAAPRQYPPDTEPGAAHRLGRTLAKLIILLLTLGVLASAMFYGYRRWQQLQSPSTPVPVVSPTQTPPPTHTTKPQSSNPAAGNQIKGALILVLLGAPPARRHRPA